MVTRFLSLSLSVLIPCVCPHNRRFANRVSTIVYPSGEVCIVTTPPPLSSPPVLGPLYYKPPPSSPPVLFSLLYPTILSD